MSVAVLPRLKVVISLASRDPSQTRKPGGGDDEGSKMASGLAFWRGGFDPTFLYQVTLAARGDHTAT